MDRSPPASARRCDAADVGLGDLAVALEREDQRHVDRDAGGDRLLDRRQARQRRGDLDEEVRAVDERVQALGLGDRGVACRGRGSGRPRARPSRRARSRPHRPSGRGGCRRPPGCRRRRAARKISFGSRLRLEHLAQLLVVGVALGDRALEDGRVGRDAVDALVDERLELAVLDEAAREEVDPDALAVGGELLQGSVGHGASSEGAGSQVRSEDASGLQNGYPARAGGPIRDGGCQRPRPDSSRNQAATACSSRRASRRRAARAWLAVTVLARGPEAAALCSTGRGGRNRPDEGPCERGSSGGTLSNQGPDDKTNLLL